MEFITVRDLRLQPAAVWDKLRRQGEVILTSNGRPVAVIAGIEEDEVEETLSALRRARAQAAASRLRRAAAAGGLDRISTREVEAEIAAARQARRPHATQE